MHIDTIRMLCIKWSLIVVFVVKSYGYNYDPDIWLGVTHLNTRQSAIALDGTTTTQLKWMYTEPGDQLPATTLNDRHVYDHLSSHNHPYFCETKRTGACDIRIRMHTKT